MRHGLSRVCHIEKSHIEEMTETAWPQKINSANSAPPRPALPSTRPSRWDDRWGQAAQAEAITLCPRHYQRAFGPRPPRGRPMANQPGIIPSQECHGWPTGGPLVA